MANTAGKATATTLVIPLHRGWAVWCGLLFAAARRFSFISAPLRRQSFIHIAHWSITDEVWGSRGRKFVYFESNFDASMSEYVDVFVQAVPWHMRMVWAGGLDYPGLYPSTEYVEWSLQHANHVQHYYAAYSDATTTEVADALEVADRLDRFLGSCDPATSDEVIDADYQRLLTEVSPWL
jgi:hypothetical protein